MKPDLISVMLGIAVIVASRAYHMATSPGWTEATALRVMWPVYLAGFVLVVLGCVLSKRK